MSCSVSRFAFALVLLGTAGACGPTEIPDARRQLLTAWVQHSLLDELKRFEQRSETLHDDVETLCASPEKAHLKAAQKSWRRARAPWKRTEVFSFGPVVDQPLRLGSEIDFWPVRPPTIEAAAMDEVDAERLGAATKGLPAVEYLLFAPEALPKLEAETERCSYLDVIAGDLSHQAKRLHDAWVASGDNYQAELTEAGRSSEMFGTLEMALGELVNRMGFLLENVRADKLLLPLGTDKTGPQPDKSESQFSNNALEDIRQNLAGIEGLFFGKEQEPSEVTSLSQLLNRRNKDLDAAFREKLQACNDALEAVEAPLTEALDQRVGRRRLTTLEQKLSELQVLIQVDVINALSLTLRFNDNDGD